MSEAINTRVDAKPTDPIVSMRQSIDKATNDAEAAGVLPGKIRDHVEGLLTYWRHRVVGFNRVTDTAAIDAEGTQEIMRRIASNRFFKSR